MKINKLVGLMGASDDGILFWPNGDRWTKLHPFISFKIQKIQHFLHKIYWKYFMDHSL